jgi:hypothetical protein
MGAELGDERSFKRALREAAGVAGKEQIEGAVHDAVEIANRALREVGNSPPPEATLDEWSVEAIADSVEVYWSPSEPSEGKLAKGDQLVAEWTHPHADKIEVGVEPHTIEGNDWLYFPWYNMPDDVREKWEPKWEDPDNPLDEPYVFRRKVEHPGIPAVGYVRAGFSRAIARHFG